MSLRICWAFGGWICWTARAKFSDTWVTELLILLLIHLQIKYLSSPIYLGLTKKSHSTVKINWNMGCLKSKDNTPTKVVVDHSNNATDEGHSTEGEVEELKVSFFFCRDVRVCFWFFSWCVLVKTQSENLLFSLVLQREHIMRKIVR